MNIKNWLDCSYKTHGNSTDNTSKGNGRNMNDTPKAKMAAIAKQTTDNTKVFGNKSGGGSSSISDGRMPKDTTTKYVKGLMRGANRGG